MFENTKANPMIQKRERKQIQSVKTAAANSGICLRRRGLLFVFQQFLKQIIISRNAIAAGNHFRLSRRNGINRAAFPAPNPLAGILVRYTVTVSTFHAIKCNHNAPWYFFVFSDKVPPLLIYSTGRQRFITLKKWVFNILPRSE
jgi:hypothetical protein